ncbi:uncharacterized protein TrAtP1_009556 [Trichoderma atroviride]|uniref:uncharacterized protein n=1 Tax=Hypocrea atroviridis TaxID=63577 RepID=UPI0033208EB8|nr:hypothetical protein TrAtP1_009556 [Trichoderma atroviride]
MLMADRKGIPFTACEATSPQTTTRAEYLSVDAGFPTSVLPRRCQPSQPLGSSPKLGEIAKESPSSADLEFKALQPAL